MDRFDTGVISAALLAAPAWARIGLTVRDPRLQERAATELAQSVIEKLEGQDEADANQLALSL
ncbi:DUF6771 family protein [Sphingomonas sp. M1-B02]|uniref:DUF6771 family protein n=1 Tax=Sphingomonas sp. M1-B02 TaxID=3114300 RepID=UPI002240C91E|nr:DUF6771 family protein [Sphingomonas sp. S6-11]UZK67778.1 hypothetical protein OKW87_08105 [Sphingomonas sp. S6-11]